MFSRSDNRTSECDFRMTEEVNIDRFLLILAVPVPVMPYLPLIDCERTIAKNQLSLYKLHKPRV